MKKLLFASLAAALLFAAPAQAAQLTPHDCSGTLGGSAQVAVPATTGSKVHVEIQNLGTHAMGFSLTTGSPAVGAAGTYTLGPASAPNPGMAWRAPVGIVPGGAISIVGTAGDIFSCSWW